MNPAILILMIPVFIFGVAVGMMIARWMIMKNPGQCGLRK